MTLAFNYLVTRISTWCKQHVELIIMIVVLIIFVLMSRAPAADAGKLLKSLRERHKTETEAIKEAYEKELSTHDEIHADEIKKHEQINKEAEDKKEALKVTIEKRIETLKEENKTNPDAVTERLSALTGIKNVKRKEKK